MPLIRRDRSSTVVDSVLCQLKQSQSRTDTISGRARIDEVPALEAVSGQVYREDH